MPRESILSGFMRCRLVGWFLWVLPFGFSPVPYIVPIFQPNASTAESPFSKVEILLCAYSLIFPNQYFYEIILEGNFLMRYQLRKK